ncbi:MAG TPA: glycosyltransferase family A protein [Gemmatimonadales bacterium]|nr:glycosyltransferase family A protein [Gemmatimonadales bacterium]
MSAAPRCTVVVPSRNRRAPLARVLEGLARQTVPAEELEVIVVLDDPTDDSEALLAEWRASGRLPRLDWVVQRPRQGQAAGRNAGAARAGAPVVLFVDDDMAPDPGLVAAHLAEHAAAAPGEVRVVLGDAPFVRAPRHGLYPFAAWAWWEDLFRERAAPGHRPAMRDFCAGNVSLPRAAFERAGGYDAGFTGYGGEDYELGWRLLRQGARFVAAPAARAEHHHAGDVAKVLRNTRQEAHGDLLLAAKHPELAAGLRLAQPLPLQTALLARVALAAPRLGDLLVGALVALLPGLERRRLRRRWFRVFKLARNYAYWRGVRDALGSWRALARWRAALPPLPRATLEVGAGLPEALPDAIPVDVPSELVVTLHGRPVGVVRLPGPTSAPLRPWVAEELILRLGPALAAAWHADDARRGAAPWYFDPTALRSTGGAAPA